MTRATQGDNVAERELAMLRRDDNNAGAGMAYSAPGTTKRVRGDEDAPFTKQPPFPSKSDVLFDGTVPFETAYVFSEEMDCEDIHVVTLLIRYTNATIAATMSILPEVREKPEDAFEPIGVVDAALSTLVPLGKTGTYLSRTIGPAEFRTTALPAADGVFEMTMQLAVGPYFQIRFGLLTMDVVTDGEAILRANGSD